MKTLRSTVRTPRQRARDQAESAAARHLIASGCRIIARNARYRDGEVDLIAYERDLLVFVEVRMRTGSRFGASTVSFMRVSCFIVWEVQHPGRSFKSAAGPVEHIPVQPLSAEVSK